MRGFLSINKHISSVLNSSKSGIQIAPRFSFSSLQKSNPTDGSNNNNNQSSKTSPIKELKMKQIHINRLNFTPHEYWITQGQGMERPFTGDKWFEKDVGYYHCSVCEKRLFTWDHKYQSPTGMATFWHHEKNAVLTLDNATGVTESTVNLQPNQTSNNQEKKRATCSGCHSHLGLIHFDGPPPTFKRFSINSAAIKFIKKEHWENPHFIHKKRKLVRLTEHEEQARKRAILKAQQERDAALSSSSSSSSGSSSSSSQSD